ncbi:hypothetical protein [Actinoallomurus iriomotensis]|uniref:Uncharacterized protein n=1 Tax=Actinoallomurus iriomotensis TaxID=478107 RepID=A0A9W6VM39_9ACTN|nr:hypothetical protein [Actinoallomurus iriomotensis]GLY72294.1 hypothetical protein Airi01_005610 [Actinoallomurus iriomotensis]
MAYPLDPEQPLPSPLTPDAATRVRDERRELLPDWAEASRALVVRLGALSRWDPPETLLENPSHGLMHMGAVCAGDPAPFEMIGYQPFDLLLTAYCAEYMFSDVGGGWVLDEDPDSPTFARFLLGEYDADDPDATVDVHAAVTAFLNEPEGRDLEELLESLQEEMGAPVGVQDTSYP